MGATVVEGEALVVGTDPVVSGPIVGGGAVVADPVVGVVTADPMAPGTAEEPLEYVHAANPRRATATSKCDHPLAVHDSPLSRGGIVPGPSPLGTITGDRPSRVERARKRRAVVQGVANGGGPRSSVPRCC